MRLFVLSVLVVLLFGVVDAQAMYLVEVSVNDAVFVINGNVYKAQTFCFDVRPGDRVVFVEGNAYGACASAKFVNLRTGKVCRVWCE